MQALQPVAAHPTDTVPDILPEILLLADDMNPDAPSDLANSLWIKYRTAFDWAWKVWDNTVASLRQVPDMTSDIAGRRVRAIRYGVFLQHVDQRLATGLDSEVLRWSLGPGKNEIAALSSDTWEVFTAVLLYLSVHGALKTTTILVGLVYPAWDFCANITAEERSSTVGTFLRAANNLCERLLLFEDMDEDGLSPANLHEVQCIRTRRQDVYCLPHFCQLASALSSLILIENNNCVSDELRNESALLRQLLSRDQDFRQGVYRNLDVVQDAFENRLQQTRKAVGGLGSCIVAGLQMILCDVPDASGKPPASVKLVLIA